MFRILLYLLTIHCAQAQISYIPQDDWVGFNWVQVEGVLKKIEHTTNDQKLLYSLEAHYRLNNQASEYHQFILRPMLGYRINNTTIWMGYAHLKDTTSPLADNESRFFQMVTYADEGNIVNSKVSFLAGLRLEQRYWTQPQVNLTEINYRMRAMLRVAYEMFSLPTGTVNLVVANEYFYRLNSTQLTGGSKEFDQNRTQLGLEFRRLIQGAPQQLTISYMHNRYQGFTNRGVNIGAKMTIPHRSQRPPRHY